MPLGGFQSSDGEALDFISSRADSERMTASVAAVLSIGKMKGGLK